MFSLFKSRRPPTRELPDVWGKGKNLFPDKWILYLSVDSHEVRIKARNVADLQHQLEYAYNKARSATVYFRDGTYLIHEDGSMHWIDTSKVAQYSGLLHIEAVIHFEELPLVETIAALIENAKPSNALEEEKNCAVIGLLAHGSGTTSGGKTDRYSPMFAIRAGKIIVESY